MKLAINAKGLAREVYRKKDPAMGKVLRKHYKDVFAYDDDRIIKRCMKHVPGSTYEEWLPLIG